VERKRRPEEVDLFVWFCEQCGNKLYETTVRFDDPTDAVKTATDQIRSDIQLRTCRQCGDVLAV
jgi:3-hydroxyanthranilate 3,4-dioxygenase